MSDNIHRDLHVPMLLGSVFIVCVLSVMLVGRTSVLNHRITQTNQVVSHIANSFQDSLSALHAEYDSIEHRYRTSHPNTIWVARAIYTESDRATEQELVAWVIRNRYEVGYKGAMTYREVVLDRYQFSAFNPGRHSRFYYATKSWYDQFRIGPSHRRWERSLEIAADVVFADASERPIPQLTLYFYSEVSMPRHRKHPSWANKFVRVNLMDHAPKDFHSIPDLRFRFFMDPECNRCGSDVKIAHDNNISGGVGQFNEKVHSR